MITKDEILRHLNKELNRNETDIDEYILSAMKKLSLADDFCWLKAETETIEGDGEYSIPTNYKKLMTITVDDGKPLAKGSYRDYMSRIGRGEHKGKPRVFALHGGSIFLYPTPDKKYQLKMDYNAFVPEKGINLERDMVDHINEYFTDIYRDALNTLTKAYYCMSKELTQEAAQYMGIFTSIELPFLSALVEREPRYLSYTDLW